MSQAEGRAASKGLRWPGHHAVQKDLALSAHRRDSQSRTILTVTILGYFPHLTPQRNHIPVNNEQLVPTPGSPGPRQLLICFFLSPWICQLI